MRLTNTVLFFFLLILGVNLPLAAQQAGSGKFLFQGIATDADTGEPLEYAAISVFSVADSSLKAGGITELDGKFSISLPAGNYYATLEFISYAIFSVPAFELGPNQPVFDLGSVGLEAEAASLTEVVIEAEQSQMQMTLDKRVFNVGKDLANAGGTAADILDNVPSVTVDLDGSVSLRGSQGVRILVDGKPSGLIGLSGTDGLRQFPANMIERVEVITNPSARYEAEGMTGIINIILKKDRRRGINGTIDLNTGTPANHGGAVNLNYRREKLNLFSNLSLQYRNNPGFGELYQEFTRDGELFFFDQNSDNDRQSLSKSARVGLEYFLNDKNTLTASALYRLSDETNNSTVEYLDYQGTYPDNLIRASERINTGDEGDENLELSLDYSKKFDQQGHEWNTSFQFTRNAETGISDILERTSFAKDISEAVPDLLQRTDNEEAQDRLVIRSDYFRPVGKEGKFEAGYFGSFSQIRNDYLVEEFSDNTWNTLANFSNDFLYDEDIHAGYLILGNKPGRFSYQLGLRAEYSLIRTELITTNEVNERDYLNLFPTAHLTYELLNGNSVQVSYSRRIRRPRFWFLNPFFSFSDARNIRTGNPNLDPSLTNSYEITHIKYWDDASISSSVYYRRSTGVIERIRTVDDEGISFTRPENLAEEDSYGVEFTFSASPKKWWRIDGDLNFFRSITNGTNIGSSFQAEATTLFGRLNTRFNLPGDLDIQARFNYRAPRNNTQGRTQALYSLDIGLGKEVLNKKATLTFNFRDIFNTRIYRSITEGDNFYAVSSGQWRVGRQLQVAFNYRLNQDDNRRRRRDSLGRDDFGNDGEF